MKIRLSFAETSPPNVKFWQNRLKSFGLEVTSARSSGIEAEGDEEAIEKALETKIDFSDNTAPVIGAVNVTEKPGDRPPFAYVPRKPTFF